MKIISGLALKKREKGARWIPAFLSKIEIVVRGQIYTEESIGPRGGKRGAELKDEELVEKFRHNAARSLTQSKINRAVNAFLNLEKVADIAEVMENVSML